MCLGIPGKILNIYEKDGMPMGKVEFGGIGKEICLAYVPEAKQDDYVLVHVGFAISIIDEAEAAEIFSYIQQIGELSELGDDAMSVVLKSNVDDYSDLPRLLIENSIDIRQFNEEELDLESAFMALTKGTSTRM